MPIVSFNFDKIHVEKKNPPKGKIDITNNVGIKSVEEKDIGKQKGLLFKFEFFSKYEPKVAEIKLEGTLIFMGKPEQIKDVAKSWKKDKKIPKEILVPVMNTMLSRCHIEAIILSQQTGLPSPLPMPKVKQGSEEKRYIG